MIKKFFNILSLAIIISVAYTMGLFAAQLDPSIPVFNSSYMSLSSDGTAQFTPPAYSGKWKRFDIQLLKRVSTVNTGLSVIYSYKTSGSVKYVEPTETSYEFTISSIGYYQFQIRGVNLEGNYGAWAMIVDSSSWATYEGVPVTEDDISAGGGSHSGIGGWSDYNYGPGVVQNYYPYGYYIGPNGEIIYNNGYNYYGNQIYNNNYPAQSTGYNANGNVYPNASNYPQVPTPNVNGMYGYNSNYYANQNGQTNPNYYNGGNYNYYSGMAGTGTPQITQGLEIGWHVDQNGRFYYQGNGVVLKGTWYMIDGSFYRFSNNGYILANQWFKDNATGYWYFLAGDGHMVTGWQNINGTWYYFKPENGNGYGTMYSNTTLQITDKNWGTGIYAFDGNGATVMNAWYGGYYYGADGKRTN